MAKRPPKKPPVLYFFPQLTVMEQGDKVSFQMISDLQEALSRKPPSLDFRLIARMRFAEGEDDTPVMLPGVWGYCDCHGWQFDSTAVPNPFGFMPFPDEVIH